MTQRKSSARPRSGRDVYEMTVPYTFFGVREPLKHIAVKRMPVWYGSMNHESALILQPLFIGSPSGFLHGIRMGLGWGQKPRPDNADGDRQRMENVLRCCPSTTPLGVWRRKDSFGLTTMTTGMALVLTGMTSELCAYSSITRQAQIPPSAGWISICRTCGNGSRRGYRTTITPIRFCLLDPL